jgi:very-short-patch-repair endonuclease
VAVLFDPIEGFRRHGREQCQRTVIFDQHVGRHLQNYRRDRRKDTLLQENGFFVLRFLAENIGKKLDLSLMPSCER